MSTDVDPVSTDRLKILFSPFTCDAEMINLGKDSIVAYQSLENYANLGEREYLNITWLHLTKLYLEQARLLGRIQRAKDSWDESLRVKFAELIGGDEIRKVKDEFERSTRDLSPEVSADDLYTIRKIFTQYFDLFTPEYFPSMTWLKCGYIAYALEDLLRELQSELTYGSTYDWKAFESVYDLFEREYARASLLDLPNAKVEESRAQWRERYGGSPERYPNWKEDELDDLLRKIDFNLKGFSKALVRVAGIGVCIAGAAGKVASIITINPVLNAIAIKGMLVGGALAVSPTVAPKLARYLHLHPKNHLNDCYFLVVFVYILLVFLFSVLYVTTYKITTIL